MIRNLLARSGKERTPITHDREELAARLRADRHAPQPPASRGRSTLARRVFDAGHKAQLPGRLARGEGRPAVADTSVNQAYDNIGITLDFLRQVIGRNSLDGRGMRVDASVHVSDNMQDATWTGRQMAIGDGDKEFGGFTACLDFVAHELFHGMTQHLIPKGLGVVRVKAHERKYPFQIYDLRGQAGALNESISDVFATMVKQWHARQTVHQADWLIGQHLLNKRHGFAVRSLKDPGNRELTWEGDHQVKLWMDFIPNGEVHANAGIPSHAFYLAAVAMDGHSWESMGSIWYAAVQQLKPGSTFAYFARATVAAADTQHGPDSRQHNAVLAAWKKVGVL